MVLSVAASLNDHIDQTNMATAFLYAALDSITPVYIHRPIDYRYTNGNKNQDKEGSIWFKTDKEGLVQFIGTCASRSRVHTVCQGLI